jgi:UDPglucose 6-dehydrogenase
METSSPVTRRAGKLDILFSRPCSGWALGAMMKIAVVGTGYIGLANAVLLAQHNEFVALDINAERVAMINRGEPTVEDAELEQFLKERTLHLVATMDSAQAYRDANFIIVATPTDYDPDNNYFDTSGVEAVVA